MPQFLTRALDFIGRHGRGLTLANIAAQGAIIVTGGAVRLTGSGLGCSTAPNCEPDSLFPDLTDLSLETAIEFGNRLLTMVVGVIAVLVLIAVWRTRPALRVLGSIIVLGVLFQAVLGKYTVDLELEAMVVAIHLWASAFLVWVSVLLALRYRDAPRRLGEPHIVARSVTWIAATVIVVLGALTTASGPHSGDEDVTDRLGLPLDEIARAHAASVWVFVLTLLYLIWRFRHDRSATGPDEVRKAWIVLAAVTVVQGAIGYTQYFTGLPELLVGIHLAGVAIFVAAHSAFHYLTKAAVTTP